VLPELPAKVYHVRMTAQIDWVGVYIKRGTRSRSALQYLVKGDSTTLN